MLHGRTANARPHLQLRFFEVFPCSSAPSSRMSCNGAPAPYGRETSRLQAQLADKTHQELAADEVLGADAFPTSAMRRR